MDNCELEDRLSELLGTDFEIRIHSATGELIIYSRLKENGDGELVDINSEDFDYEAECLDDEICLDI